ncbi:hypothetical protein ALQ20_200232 [Pseudomonas syringae pv. atrofaciens]|nr:hypothetical protein ALQ20_200232 [Pseudomonas syringae pv. atrofaciens]
MEVFFRTFHPLRVRSQAGQLTDILMKAPAYEVRHRVTQQPAEKTQQQHFAQRQYAAARQGGDGKHDDRARHDDPDDRDAFNEGHQKDRDSHPGRVCGQPASHSIEQIAHRSVSLIEK